MTDDEKHEFCQKRGYPSAVFLPPSVYRAAELAGDDMLKFIERVRDFARERGDDALYAEADALIEKAAPELEAA